MINATKLLGLITKRSQRTIILRNERVKHVVVRLGPKSCMGTWIPFQRAMAIAKENQITEILYPLFVHNIRALLQHPINRHARDYYIMRTSVPSVPPPPRVLSSKCAPSSGFASYSGCDSSQQSAHDQDSFPPLYEDGIQNESQMSLGEDFSSTQNLDPQLL